MMKLAIQASPYAQGAARCGDAFSGDTQNIALLSIILFD
jgi:hypothetical protein